MTKPALSIFAVVLLTPLTNLASGQPAVSPPTSAAAASAANSLQSAEDALRLVGAGEYSNDEAAIAHDLLAAAAEKDPGKVDWQIGLALWNLRSRNFSVARDIVRKATTLAPESAQAWAARGTVIFMSIGEAPTLDKMGLADEGKEA